MLLLATSMIPDPVLLVRRLWPAADPEGRDLRERCPRTQQGPDHRRHRRGLRGLAALRRGPEVPAAVRPAVCARRDPFRQGQATRSASRSSPESKN
ncbi:hypothetical protein ACPA9J_20105 [Pseudomonas aeruginosa]